MSWYTGRTKPQIQVEETPQKKVYTQVPSSSPITVGSSPTKNQQEADMELPPSIKAHSNIDEAKQRALESRREAIRNHKDFPVVRKRFYYLQESDIFKGFVKGKGNLRDITKWLTDNYNEQEILNKQQSQRRQQQEKSEELLRQRNQQQMMREYQKVQETERLEAERRKKLEAENQRNQQDEDDEDESPIKVRGKAKRKAVESPVKQKESANSQSTKVELGKPKLSILDKYKARKSQPSIVDAFSQRLPKSQNDSSDGSEEPPRKKKLVRLAGLHDDYPRSVNTSASTSPEPSNINTLKSFSYKGPNGYNFKKSDSGNVINIKSSSPGPSDQDDLEILEERIRQNKRNKSSNGPIVIDEDDLEDDDASDDMSGDDYAESNGLTSMDSQILEFLNNATQQDIIEIGNVPPKIGDSVISRRPIEDIYTFSEDRFESEEAKEAETAPKKRKGARKPLGMKIIENIETSLKGYRAVDSLVKKCSQVGNLVSEQMEAWGVTVTGAEGELEMVDIDPTKESIEIDANDDENADDSIQVIKSHKKTLTYIHEPPENFTQDLQLKNYQLVGINWLNLLYSNNLSCILADEMGLGKTCQVIAFMAYLKQTKGEGSGRHLVVVPSSTLENWLREFNKFCPDIIVQAYYGSQAEREELRYELRSTEYDVLVTTYNLASGSSNDFKFLKNNDFDMVVYDEGHMLKNSNSERYTKLMRLRANFRLLLTGTPLQNNLKELVSLLAFMLPHLFEEKKEDLQSIFNQKVKTTDADSDENYNPLLSVQAISKAKTMMTPFVLRRKKDQVLKHLPAKIHRIEYCEPTDSQKAIYKDYMDQGKNTRLERERRKLLTGKEAEEARKTPIPTSSNVLMSLRKASLHPLLFRRHFTSADLSKMSKKITNEPEYADANSHYIFEDMEVLADYELDALCRKFPKTLGEYILKDEHYLDSGKVQQLSKILNSIIEKKEKVLVFSLFTQVLDILEKVLSILQIKFTRLDGLTSVENRQDLIDTFYEDDTIPVFLLSTRAGGFGINLVAANNVIIFDQSFNPHDDKQAEDRAHRVGQTSEVVVTRLISTGTVEENILQLAENKLQLDQSISNDGADKIVEEKAANLFEKLLFDS